MASIPAFRAAAALLLLLCATRLHAAPAYAVRVLGPPALASATAGINQAGDVAGRAAGDAFVWHAGSMRFVEDTALGNVAFYLARDWFPLGVDSAGNLLAYSSDSDNANQALRLDSSGLHAYMVALGYGVGGREYRPTGAFANGQIAGVYFPQGVFPARTSGFLSQGDRLVPFTLPGWTDPIITAINALGWIAGSGTYGGKPAGFLARGTSVYDLGSFFPTLLNDRGNLASNTTVWIGSKSFPIAPLPGVAGSPTPLGMNNRAEIVGTQGGVAFLWTPERGTENLTNAASVDWTILRATGINDAGAISADGQASAAASPHALILMPVRTAAARSRP